MWLTPFTISQPTVRDAWRACADRLLAEGSHLNLLVHITSPAHLLEPELRELDPRSVEPESMSVFDVATTIFPRQTSRWEMTPNDFAKHYTAIYARLKRRTQSGWGFYFQRLASFGASKAPQLARVVDGLSTWGRNHHGAFVVHFSSAETDRPRRRGGPCLQYVQFTPDADTLSLTAVYRSHDYFHKALGNFVGLARLLGYVCRHTGHEVGAINCLSTYAFVGARRSQMKALLDA